MRELSLSGASKEGGKSQEDKDDALKQIKEERAALGSSRKILEELLTRVKSKLKKLELTFTNKQSP